LALLGLAVMALGLPASALAAPQVKVTVKILPILKDQTKPKGGFWPHTGNFLGAPASLETKFTIKGIEYKGFPAPIRKVAVYLPKGVGINTKGFQTCSISLLEAKEPERCPKGSLASPAGFAPQSVKIQAYFAPGGGLNFFVEGVDPTVIEIPFAGSFSGASGLFGKKFSTEVPLIETLPGADAAVAETTSVTIGAAIKKGGKLISLGTIPKKCPKGGFPGKGEMWFGAGPEATWEKVTIETKVPCPKK
jgi:hypothetical protein